MIAGKKYTVTNLQILCEFLQGWFENTFATDGKDCIVPVGLRKCADCSCNVLAGDQLCDRQYNLLVRGQTKPPAYIRFVDTEAIASVSTPTPGTWCTFGWWNFCFAAR